MRRVTLAGASLLLLVGLAAGCGDDGGDDDSTAEEASSQTPTQEPTDDEPSTDPSDNESGGASQDATEDPSQDASSEAPTDSGTPATGNVEDYCAASKDANAAQDVDSLRTAVQALSDNLPDSATKKQRSGLDALQDILADAGDMNDFVNQVQTAKQDNPDMAAYMAYEQKTCGGTP